MLLLIDDTSPTGIVTLDGRGHVADTFDGGHHYLATNGVVRAIGGVAYAIDAVLLPDDVGAAMIPAAAAGADAATDDYWSSSAAATLVLKPTRPHSSSLFSALALSSLQIQVLQN